MIKRKVMSWMLAVAMILSLFVGIGVNDKVAGAVSDTYDDINTGIKWAYTVLSSTEIGNLYMLSCENNRLSNVQIDVPTKISGRFVKSIGRQGMGGSEYDSFFNDTIAVYDNVIINAAKENSQITTVNANVGYGEQEFSLYLPKNASSVSANVLCGFASHKGKTNHIYCDALYASYANSSFSGTFHGMANSTAAEYYGAGKTASGATFVGKNESAKVTFKFGAASWPNAPSYLYLYTNDADNKDINLNSVPSKEYYDFNGFWLGDTKIFNSDGSYNQTNGGAASLNAFSVNELEAKFNKKTYSISIYNESTNTTTPYTTAEYGKYILPTKDTQNISNYAGTKTGYSLAGFNTSNNAATAETEITLDSPVTLYPVWSAKSYKFMFEPGDAGSNARSMPTSPTSVKFGSSGWRKAIDKPTCTGKTFIGWKIKDTNKDLPRDIVYEDVWNKLTENGGSGISETNGVTLIAQWSTNTYNLTYKDSDDSIIGSTETKYLDGNTKQTKSGPTKTGRTFLYWKSNKGKNYGEGSNGVENVTNDFGASSGENVVLTAVYKDNVYSIVYYADTTEAQNIGTSQISCSSDRFNIISSVPTKKGCVFMGWTTVKSDAEKTYNPSDTKTAPYTSGMVINSHFTYEDGVTVKMYPMFKLERYDIIYTYDASNGIIVLGDMPTSYVYGETKTLPKLSWTGHTFLGWFTSGGVEVKEIKKTDTGDVTVTAKWDNLYSAGIVGNGIKTISCSKGTIASSGKATGLLFAAGDVLDKLTISVMQGYEITGYSIKENKTNKIVVEESLSKPSDKMVASKNYTFSTSDIIIEVKCKVIVNELPAGTVTTVSENGKYLIITDSNGVKKYVEIPKQGSELKDGMNEIQFTAQDGMVYKTTVSFTQPKQISTDAEVRVDSAGKYIVITYPSGDEQYVNIDLFNSETSNGVTKVFFEQSDGKKCYAIVDASTEVIPEEEKPDDEKDDDQKEETAKTFYHVASNVSYRIKNGYATASNPKKWYDLKKIVIKSSVKVDGVTYKIKSIDKLAFFGLESLKTVTIGKNVTKIGSKAFMKCGKLNKITIKASNLTSIGKNCFKDISKKCTIYIVAKKAEYTKLVKLIKKKSGCPKKTKFKRVKP